MLTNEQFDRKWPEIKGGLRNLWGQLSEDEIEEARENVYAVTEVVEDRYQESREEIRKKIDQLMKSFDNDTDKETDPDVSSYHRRP